MSSPLPIPPPPGDLSGDLARLVRWSPDGERSVSIPLSLLPLALRGEHAERDAWATGLVTAQDWPGNLLDEP